MPYNLIMAGIWMLLGTWMIVYHQYNPDSSLNFKILGTNLSAGWLMIGIGIYNLIRWWATRMQEQARQMSAQEAERRRLEERAERRREKPVIHPEFDFSDKPPDPPQQAGP